MTLSPTKNLVRFGPYELDTSAWQLRRNGTRIKLPQQPLQLLAMLVERPGVVFSREELRQRLWPSEVFVDFDHGLNKNIQKLREALGDSPDSPHYIETIPRVGYRFIGVVGDPAQTTAREMESSPSPVAVTLVPNPTPPQNTRKQRSLWVVLAVSAIGLILAVWLVHRRLHVAAIQSLAVLPLENLSGDPNQEYLAEGMTDELITELARIPALRVVSRNSVMLEKGSRKPLRQIAQELNVDAVVEGSVVHVGDKVRITAQLIDAREDKHPWARSFEEPGSDILALEDTVAREIASQTRIALTPPQPHAPQRIDPGAQDAYLRGLYFFDRREALKSKEYFQQAISLEPTFAAAYAGLAQALTLQSFSESGSAQRDVRQKSLIAAKRAIELDPQGGEAFTALGQAEMLLNFDWAAAGRDLERGIAFGPNDSVAESEYAIYLDATNRPQEAVIHMRRARALDPLSFIMNRHLGSALYFARQYDEALYYLHLASEMHPVQPGLVWSWVSWVYMKKGMHAEVVRAALIALDLKEAETNSLLSVYQQRGWTAYLKAMIPLLGPPGEDCNSVELSWVYVQLGDYDQAFSSLNRAIDGQCRTAMIFLKVNPLFDEIRTDPRYPQLLKRLNIPG